MKKSDTLTPIGIIGGTILILFGMSIGGTDLTVFYNLTAILITVGGSFCALIITYSLEELKDIGKIFKQSFKRDTTSCKMILSQFIDVSKKARIEGLLSLEDNLVELQDSFMQKGLQMVIDGVEPEVIKEVMNLEIDEAEARHKVGINIFKTWANYAPAFGMIGTLVGLIQMLGSGMSDVSSITIGMAKALVTVFYGVLLSNLLLLPTAQNLNVKSEKETKIKEMMLEGVLLIQSGASSGIIEEKLIAYLSPKERLELIKEKTALKQEEVI